MRIINKLKITIVISIIFLFLSPACAHAALMPGDSDQSGQYIVKVNTEYAKDINKYDYEYSETSFSAPVVSALAALALARDNSLSADDLLSLISETSEDLGDSGYDKSYGYGLLNPALLLAKLTGNSSLILSYFDGSYCISNYSEIKMTDTNLICLYDANAEFISAEFCNLLCNYVIDDSAGYIKLLSLDSDCRPLKKETVY